MTPEPVFDYDTPLICSQCTRSFLVPRPFPPIYLQRIEEGRAVSSHFFCSYECQDAWCDERSIPKGIYGVEIPDKDCKPVSIDATVYPAGVKLDSKVNP